MRQPTATATLLVAVRDDGTETALGWVDAQGPDLALVETLMRLQLLARRRGARLCLRNASEDLNGLLELVGLADALGVEPGRQPELGEELGVEEVVQPGDAAV